MRDEEGEMSNRVSPRKHQIKKFEMLGIKIKECKFLMQLSVFELLKIFRLLYLFVFFI